MKQEKINRYEINTPVPAPKHLSCLVCNKQYHEGEYKNHIRGEEHAQSVRANGQIYGAIDKVIDELNEELFAETEYRPSYQADKANQSTSIEQHDHSGTGLFKDTSYNFDESYTNALFIQGLQD